MKRKLYLTASAILILCISATMLTSCRKEEKNVASTLKTTEVTSTESVTEISGSNITVIESDIAEEASETTQIYTYNDNQGYTVYSYVEATNAPTAVQTQQASQTNAPTPEITTAVATTVNTEEYPTVPEKNNGLMCVRTQYASRGQIVTVSVVMGTPNAEYSIEFYESETRLSDVNGLDTKRADSGGNVEWSFLIDDDCELGNRKLVIKEKGSDKYAQTFITVNG